LRSIVPGIISGLSWMTTNPRRWHSWNRIHPS